MLTGCGTHSNKEMSLNSLTEQIKVVAEIDNATTENLTDQGIAGDYGISVKDIAEGYVIRPSDKNTVDEIIFVRAKNDDSIENIEKAIASELTSKTEAWKNDPNEKTKIDNHVMKTIDDCVLLAICEKSKEVEQVFNIIEQ